MPGSRDYVVVPVGNIPGSKPRKSFSPLRFWKRASTCQRNFSLLILFIIAASFFLYYSQNPEVEEEEEESFGSKWRQKRRDSNHAVNMAQIDTGQERNHVQLPQLDEIKKKAIQELEDKIQQDLKRRPSRKRGPPGRPHSDEMQVVPVDLGIKSDVADDHPAANTNHVLDQGHVNPIKIPAPKEVHLDIDFGNSPQTERQKFVVEMMKHAWKGYRANAWGHDHLHPISHQSDDWFHVGLTILDAVDTLYMMGLKNEYNEVREWVDKQLSFDKNIDVNLFECTIRVFGSMLTMYHLTHDRLYLDKAIDIGNRLLPALTKSHTAVPFSDVNLKTGNAHAPKWGPDSSVSEVTTIQLEFRDLTFLTGDPKYKDAVDKVSLHVHNLSGKKDGLVPMWINANHGRFREGSTFTVGARADSYYEYLIKQYIQTGYTEQMYLDDYINAIKGMQKHLIGKSIPSYLTYVGELIGGKTPSAKMDHLVCFLGGTLALGSTVIKSSSIAKEHLELGKNITKTCHEMYVRTPTGLSPEITYFNLNVGGKDDVIIKPLDRHNLLRPETIESLFYLWRITKDEKYRDWGWEIAQAFEKYSKVPGGYTSLKNVMDPANTMPMDKMESFFLGETLKYLYLLFSDDDKLFPLDKWVFNTEAHPLPIHYK